MPVLHEPHAVNEHFAVKGSLSGRAQDHAGSTRLLDPNLTQAADQDTYARRGPDQLVVN
jgi:hypothetical protein